MAVPAWLVRSRRSCRWHWHWCCWRCWRCCRSRCWRWCTCFGSSLWARAIAVAIAIRAVTAASAPGTFLGRRSRLRTGRAVTRWRAMGFRAWGRPPVRWRIAGWRIAGRMSIVRIWSRRPTIVVVRWIARRWKSGRSMHMRRRRPVGCAVVRRWSRIVVRWWPVRVARRRWSSHSQVRWRRAKSPWRWTRPERAGWYVAWRPIRPGPQLPRRGCVCRACFAIAIWRSISRCCARRCSLGTPSRKWGRLAGRKRSLRRASGWTGAWWHVGRHMRRHVWHPHPRWKHMGRRTHRMSRRRPHPVRRCHSRRWHSWHHVRWRHAGNPAIGRTWRAGLLRGRTWTPVLGEVDPDLRRAYSLPGEADGPVDASRVGELDVAEERAAALALVQSNFSDLATFAEDFPYLFFGDFSRKASDPHRSAILGLLRLWHSPVFADPVRSQRLVLSEIHANGDSMDRRASQRRSLVNGLCLEELDVAELAVSQLVYLQADHLNSTTWLKEVDDVLLGGLYGNVTDPERVAIRGLDALGSVPSAARCLRFQLRVVGHLVHVGIVYLDLDSHEVVALLLHRFVHVPRVLKLHMREVTTHVTFTASDLHDLAAVLKEVLKLLLLGLLVHPTDPDGFTTFRLLWSVRSSATPSAVVATSATRSPSPTASPSSTAAAAWRTRGSASIPAFAGSRSGLLPSACRRAGRRRSGRRPLGRSRARPSWR
mmetsp:Transcript_65856/g.157327  ORF Transcript_65856/g.157327 Transcript_65856/m.157327 type:complete len:707 (-) Transcript_65856:116-2236(-)